MAESMDGVEEGEGEVAALREALRQQARAVEELRAELEEERRAASSGADEALAMILRLQAEKAAERMEAEQFRRLAEERIQHDEDTLAFLKAVVFHQEMEISSLNRRLLAVQAAGGGTDPLFTPAAAVDLPWLTKFAKNGTQARRNASLPAASLEELCSELDGAADNSYACKNRKPVRTVSDIGEVIGRENDLAIASQLPPPPRLHRSASHHLRRSPSYSAQCGMRPASRSSPPPEIIAEEDERAGKMMNSNPALDADIEQLKSTVQSLQTELTKLRESTVSIGDAHSRLLTDIHGKLDRTMPEHQTTVQGPSPQVKAVMEEGSSSSSSSSSMVPQPPIELLMNQFIEVCGLTFSALLVRPLLKVAASMSLLRCFLALASAMAIRKVLMSS